MLPGKAPLEIVMIFRKLSCSSISYIVIFGWAGSARHAALLHATSPGDVVTLDGGGASESQIVEISFGLSRPSPSRIVVSPYYIKKGGY